MPNEIDMFKAKLDIIVAMKRKGLDPKYLTKDYLNLLAKTLVEDRKTSTQAHKEKNKA